MQYKYVTDNNLLNKQNYMYSDFGGAEFLKAYFESREQFINNQLLNTKRGGITHHITRDELKDLLDGNKGEKQNQETLNYYIKNFEVRKRVYSEYDARWKPVENATYEDYELYLMLAECCIRAHKHNECMKYLNCCLKIDDTLLSVSNLITDSQKIKLSSILEQEIKEVKKLEIRMRMVEATL